MRVARKIERDAPTPPSLSNSLSIPTPLPAVRAASSATARAAARSTEEAMGGGGVAAGAAMRQRAACGGALLAPKGGRQAPREGRAGEGRVRRAVMEVARGGWLLCAGGREERMQTRESERPRTRKNSPPPCFPKARARTSLPHTHSPPHHGHGGVRYVALASSDRVRPRPHGRRDRQAGHTHRTSCLLSQMLPLPPPHSPPSLPAHPTHRPGDDGGPPAGAGAAWGGRRSPVSFVCRSTPPPPLSGAAVLAIRPRPPPSHAFSSSLLPTQTALSAGTEVALSAASSWAGSSSARWASYSRPR